MLEFFAAYAILTVLWKWWERHGYRIPWLEQPSETGIATDLTQLMPGRALTFGYDGREFTVVEREEFELIVRQAGYELKRT